MSSAALKCGMMPCADPGANMVMKSDHEKKLLEVSKTFDGAISQKDVSSLTDLLAKDAILHHGELKHEQVDVPTLCM